MLTEKQKLRNEKILYVCKLFIENENLGISDISEITKIPKSTIQRYLNNPSIRNLISENAYSYIKTKLRKSKIEGAVKGGKLTALSNKQKQELLIKFSDNN